MRISLDHFESKYGTYTGKRLLFAINCLIYYIVMMIAVNNLGINPFTAFSNITKAINTVIGIRTFEDIVSESTISVLDSKKKELQCKKSAKDFKNGVMYKLNCYVWTEVPQNMGMIIEDWGNGGSITGEAE